MIHNIDTTEKKGINSLILHARNFSGKFGTQYMKLQQPPENGQVVQKIKVTTETKNKNKVSRTIEEI